VLFLTKGEPTRDIWYYEHQFPKGVKAYNKTKPMRLSEFDEEKNWWNKRKETEKAWKVSAKDIAANNYNLDIKNPNTPIETHEDPDELLKKYEEVVKQVEALLQQLKASLQQSLSN
jgi:type I restriction enzyme M protein